MNNNGIKISPEFYQKNWTDLDLSRNCMVNWNKAIEIFEDRINGRYLKQIEALDKNEDLKIRTFSGFAIMSLACLLTHLTQKKMKFDRLDI